MHNQAPFLENDTNDFDIQKTRPNNNQQQQKKENLQFFLLCCPG